MFATTRTKPLGSSRAMRSSVSAPCFCQLSYTSARKASLSLLREPFCRPPPLFPARNRPVSGSVVSPFFRRWPQTQQTPRGVGADGGGRFSLATSESTPALHRLQRRATLALQRARNHHHPVDDDHLAVLDLVQIVPIFSSARPRAGTRKTNLPARSSPGSGGLFLPSFLLAGPRVVNKPLPKLTYCVRTWIRTY
jgi:hypothetical protein